MNRRDYEMARVRAPKWHLKNFKGESFREIARNEGVPVELVKNAVRRFRFFNGYLSPEEKRLEKIAETRRAPILTLPERAVLRVIVTKGAESGHVTVASLMSATHRNASTVRSIVLSLQEKEFVCVRPGKIDTHTPITPLMDERGTIVTPEYKQFDVGQDGVKRYKKPLYADGYVIEDGAMRPVQME